MDIQKYLNGVEVPAENEEEAKKFLSEKETAIRESILKHWEEYSLTNPQPDKVVAVEIPTVPLAKETANQFAEEKNDAIIAKQESVISGIQNTTPPQTAILLETKQNDAFERQIKSKTIILPNGKANIEYKYQFRFKDLGLEEIGDFWFEGIEKTGLAFNHETDEILGIPNVAGDHKIKLKIKRKDWTEGKPIFEREITLIINPDPKTLWKNIPTPNEIEYFKQDCAKSFIRVKAVTNVLGFGKNARKDMVAASQRGRSHAQEGKPRDDDFALKYLKEFDWYILTVADGAGSAKSSRKGSEIACKTVMDVCENLIQVKHTEFERLIKEFSNDKTGEKRKKMGDSLYHIIGTAVFKAVKNIEEEAKLKGKPLKDFSTTLIVSVCKKFKFGWFVAAFWVGDGGIGIYNKETQFLKLLGESDGGEFAGQTRFLTMPEITQPTELYRRLRFDIVDDFTALILMTDGVTDPKFETDANLMKVEKWNDLWNDLSKEVDFSDDNEASADQLLKWLDFWSPGNHDDRTIAILF
ncbi:MAG: PP2C family serine/threonine-protein phosphatase [Bacteroidota bacterium]